MQTITKWIERARGDVEVIISIDEDDLEATKYKTNAVDLNAKLIINKNRSAVDAINNAAKNARGNIFIVVSDDTDCPDGWDEKILAATKGRENWILKTQDGIQKWLITMPVMDRAYYNRFGYVYYPEYRHMFCDTELSCVADMTCSRIDSPVLFRHLHYSIGHSERDEVSIKADKTWQQGEDLFLQRYQMNFGLPSDHCGIRNSGQLRWIQEKLSRR